LAVALRMSYCIVELQGYSTKEYSLLPKEVFLCSENESHKYFIKPPKDIEKFSPADKKIIDWNSFKYHHLPWPCGTITLGDFVLDIKERVAKYKFIICKGAEKATYLTKILNRPVTDITFYGCPSIRKKPAAAPCGLHFNKKNTHCARASAIQIKEFIHGQPAVKKLFSEN
jgi:hypothetical protein